MSTAHISGRELLKAVQQLEPAEFDEFLAQALSSRKRPVPATLSPRESRLIQQINRGVPPETCERYESLARKRKRQTLTAEEHRELLELTRDIEMLDADRASALLDLAKLRRVPIRVLMKELDIKAAPVNG